MESLASNVGNINTQRLSKSLLKWRSLFDCNDKVVSDVPWHSSPEEDHSTPESHACDDICKLCRTPPISDSLLIELLCGNVRKSIEDIPSLILGSLYNPLFGVI